jgi:hypothetical protein
MSIAYILFLGYLKKYFLIFKIIFLKEVLTWKVFGIDSTSLQTIFITKNYNNFKVLESAITIYLFFTQFDVFKGSEHYYKCKFALPMQDFPYFLLFFQWVLKNIWLISFQLERCKVCLFIFHRYSIRLKIINQEIIN